MQVSRTDPNQPFRLRSRAKLIGAVVLMQTLVIGLGWLATLQLARSGLDGRVRQTAAERNERLAETFASLLSQEVHEPLAAGSAALEKAQSLVDNYKLPNGTTLFLLSESGRVVCHPALRRSDNLRRVDYSELIVTLAEGHPATLGSLNPLRPVSGEADFLSGPAAVSVVYSRDTRTKIVVQTALQGAMAETSRLTDGAFLWAALAGAGMLVATIVGVVLLVRRYDTVLMRANRQLEDELDRRIRRAMAIRNGMIFGLAKLADFRDMDTGKHLERICRYCELLAEELRGKFPEIDRAWVERLKLASSLHDIGKVGIPDAVLLKSSGLTAEERRVMQSHVILGTDTLIAVRRHAGDDDLINMAIQVTLSHHERWDGQGYPYGMSGEQIPLAARIVALADIYDALTSRRVYKLAMSHEEASRIIVESRGTQLDPAIVAAFERIAARFDEVRKELQTQSEELPPLLAAVEHLAAVRRRAA